MSAKKLAEILGSSNGATDSEISILLAECWDDLQGSDEGGMQAYKLHERMEKINWTSPVLRFVIERHGAAKFGSSRAEMQEWEINLKEMTANITGRSYRQLTATAPRAPVKEIAESLSESILSRSNDDRIKWMEDGSVRILTSQIFPTNSGYQQTIKNRRRNLIKRINDLLRPHGWTMKTGNRFIPNTHECSPNS